MNVLWINLWNDRWANFVVLSPKRFYLLASSKLVLQKPFHNPFFIWGEPPEPSCIHAIGVAYIYQHESLTSYYKQSLHWAFSMLYRVQLLTLSHYKGA